MIKIIAKLYAFFYSLPLTFWLNIARIRFVNEHDILWNFCMRNLNKIARRMLEDDHEEYVLNDLYTILGITEEYSH